MKSIDHLFLIFGGLNAQPQNLRAQSLELLVVIPKLATLRRATSCARDLIPAFWQCNIGLASHGITIEDQPTLDFTQVEDLATGRH